MPVPGPGYSITVRLEAPPSASAAGDRTSAVGRSPFVLQRDEVGDDEEEAEAAPDDEVDPLDDGGPRPAAATKKEAVDRTDDPVRMYLREMGAVELLSREGEIAIAKRIEAGRDTMIWGLCESPITFNAIIEWSNNLNEGVMQLREILDLEAMLSKGPTPEQITAAQRKIEGIRDVVSRGELAFSAAAIRAHIASRGVAGGGW